MGLPTFWAFYIKMNEHALVNQSKKISKERVLILQKTCSTWRPVVASHLPAWTKREKKKYSRSYKSAVKQVPGAYAARFYPCNTMHEVTCPDSTWLCWLPLNTPTCLAVHKKGCPPPPDSELFNEHTNLWSDHTGMFNFMAPCIKQTFVRGVHSGITSLCPWCMLFTF